MLVNDKCYEEKQIRAGGQAMTGTTIFSCHMDRETSDQDEVKEEAM